MFHRIEITLNDARDVHLIRGPDAPKDLVTLLGMLRAAEAIALRTTDATSEVFRGPQRFEEGR